MKRLQLSLCESDTKLVLEAIEELENKWRTICEASSDPDEIADLGNDLVSLRLLARSLADEATVAFGPDVMQFGREPL